MRRSEDMPLDPFAAAELEAIEAALAGREVDPEHAELAELSVLLATDHQYPDAPFTRELDARVGSPVPGTVCPAALEVMDLAPGARGRPYGGAGRDRRTGDPLGYADRAQRACHVARV